jgi:hypothetical protein
MQCRALGPCRATDDTVQLSGAVKSWPGLAGSTIVLPSVFPARDTSMASRCSPSSSTKVSWRWCGRQLSGCRRRPPWGTGGAGATRVAASLSATRKRRRRPSAAALIAERASRNAVVNIGRTQPELRRALARRPRLVLSPRRRRASCTARQSPSANWAPSTPTPRRSATWAKVGEGHAVTGCVTGIVAFSTYFPRRMHSLPKYRI